MPLEWMQPMQPWSWWILALVLAALELVTPALFFLGIATGAFFTGLMAWTMPASWQVQLIFFVLFSFLSVFLWRRGMAHHLTEKTDSSLNQGSRNHIGKTYPVTEAIVGGRGKVRIGDGVWVVEGEDCAIGTVVQVVSVDGTVLKVVKAGG
jgi:inner membrane protein